MIRRQPWLVVGEAVPLHSCDNPLPPGLYAALQFHESARGEVVCDCIPRTRHIYEPSRKCWPTAASPACRSPVRRRAPRPRLRYRPGPRVGVPWRARGRRSESSPGTVPGGPAAWSRIWVPLDWGSQLQFAGPRNSMVRTTPCVPNSVFSEGRKRTTTLRSFCSPQCRSTLAASEPLRSTSSPSSISNETVSPPTAKSIRARSPRQSSRTNEPATMLVSSRGVRFSGPRGATGVSSGMSLTCRSPNSPREPS